MKILETDDYKTSAKSYISSRLSELNDQAFAAALREIIFQSNINWKDVQLILARHMPEVKLEVTEPSNFAPNGRCYYNNPKDWKEKHAWVSDKMDDAGYTCKGRSPWNSTWVKGADKIEVDYWDDFDVIKEYVGMSLLESNSVLTESYGYEKDPLIINLNKFLEDNNCPNYCHETTDGKMICEIYQGDWKHDHLLFKHLVDAFFTNKGMKYNLERTHYEPSDGDWYTATYMIEVGDGNNTVEASEFIENDNVDIVQ